MTEISEFVKLYVDQEVTPELVKEMKNELLTGMQKTFYDDNPVQSGYGYDTGQLFRDLKSTGDVYHGGGILTGYFTVTHGEYIQYGTKRGVKAIDFLGHGVDYIIKLYGG